MDQFNYAQLVSGICIINPYHATDFFLDPLRTPENLCFLVFSGGIEKDR